MRSYPTARHASQALHSAATDTATRLPHPTVNPVNADSPSPETDTVGSGNGKQEDTDYLFKFKLNSLKTNRIVLLMNSSLIRLQIQPLTQVRREDDNGIWDDFFVFKGDEDERSSGTKKEELSLILSFLAAVSVA